jgi:hypothetical protein
MAHDGASDETLEIASSNLIETLQLALALTPNSQGQAVAQREMAVERNLAHCEIVRTNRAAPAAGLAIGLPDLARELVERGVAVLAAPGSSARCLPKRRRLTHARAGSQWLKLGTDSRMRSIGWLSTTVYAVSGRRERGADVGVVLWAQTHAEDVFTRPGLAHVAEHHRRAGPSVATVALAIRQPRNDASIHGTKLT